MQCLPAMDFDGLKAYIWQKMETGFPGHLHYHNPAHVRDVYQAAEKLALAEGVSSGDTCALLTAVLFHDTGFMRGETGHEELSCQIAREDLPRFGYSPAEVDTICRLILATRIPQKPTNHLEEIICDADLDYLGRDDFWEIGNRLFEELRVKGYVQTIREWNEIQVAFLEAHRYFTRTAQNARNPTKARHLNELKIWLQS